MRYIGREMMEAKRRSEMDIRRALRTDDVTDMLDVQEPRGPLGDFASHTLNYNLFRAVPALGETTEEVQWWANRELHLRRDP